MVVLASCFPPSSISVGASFVNPSASLSLSSHLPLEDIPLIQLYSFLTAIYCTVLAMWLKVCSETTQDLFPIHGLIGSFLSLRAVSFWFSHTGYSSTDSTGEASPAIQAAAAASFALADAFFVSTLVLVSFGWATTRLRGRQSFTAMSILGIFAALSISSAVCDKQNGTGSCEHFKGGVSVIRSVILLVVIIGTNFNFTRCRGLLNELLPPISPAMAKKYERLDQLGVFRLCFLFYLLLPTILAIVEATVVHPWPFAWVNAALDHGLFLALAAYVGIALAPVSTNLAERPFRHQAAE